MRKEIIFHIHEISITPLIFKNFLRKVVSITASKTIFVSESVKKSEYFSKKKQYVVYNSIPYSFSVNEKHISNKSGPNFNVLMISSLKKYKGINEFIELSQLTSKFNHINYTLILNANISEIEVFTKNKKLGGNIKILPAQKNVIPFYQKSNLLLNLSHTDLWVETFGLTILEAMTFGIPVIVPPVGGPVEIVTNGVEGFLISSKNVDAISKKIIELSFDSDKIERLSINAVKRSKFFNETKFEKKIISIINE